MTTDRSRRMSLATIVVVTMLVVGACSGTKGDPTAGGSGSGDSASPMEAYEPDAANCPVDALDEADGPVEIEVWHPYFVLSQTAMQDIVDRYNASQSRVKVNLEY